jgi:hypothetical protein
METEVTKKNAIIFNCSLCDFKSCKESNYIKHLSTRKHLSVTVGDKKNAKKCQKKITEKCLQFNCQKCSKIYKSRNGLWKHNKLCIKVESCHVEDELCLKTMFIKVVEQNKAILLENQEMRKLLQDTIPKIGNNNTTNNNNKFNLNIFLNEKCKDALNINDFINSIRLKLTDLELVAKLGYTEGISKIFVKELKDLDVYKRPIHCSDIKRETLYIKDEDHWTKEDEEKRKLKQAIHKITHKNIQNISNWVQQNPDCKDNTSRKNDEYMKLISNCMSGESPEEQTNNVNKIISNVAKEVIIEKDK